MLEMWVIRARSHLPPSEWTEEMDLRAARILSGEELIELDRLLVQVAQDSDDPPSIMRAFALMRAWRASTQVVAPSARPMHPAVSEQRSHLLVHHLIRNFDSQQKVFAELTVAPPCLTIR